MKHSIKNPQTTSKSWLARQGNSPFLSGSLALILLICSVYLPFLGTRLVRTAGDEKVYISQAIEMQRAGSWFVQRLQDEPNYYKGPLHYVLLRVGMSVFGHSPWAVLYMNLFFVVCGALAIAAIIRRHYPKWKGGDLWTGAAFALSTGIYAHCFASQMEIELAGLFAVGAWCLDRLRPEQSGWVFWWVCGTLGWIKSPLHSVFLGVAALIYWALNGSLLKRLKNLRAWGAVLSGVLLCVAGYLPAYLLDRQNFLDNYIVRETLRKSDGSGQGWSVAILSTFGFYLFPWLLLALVAYVETIFKAPWLWKNKSSNHLIKLGFSIFLPSAIFFCWHTYRFENYNLPVIGGVWLWIAAVWGRQCQDSMPQNSIKKSSRFWPLAYTSALALTAVIFLALPILLSILALRFAPLPQWWPSWLLIFVWMGSLLSALGFFIFGVLEKAQRPHLLALSSGGYLWALGALLMVIGEREMLDLRTYLQKAQTHPKSVQLVYYNLNRNIWSEWGYLGFWINHEVLAAHKQEQLTQALNQKATILLSAKENSIEDFQLFLSKNFPQARLHWIPWKRWRTRGQSDSGKPLWQEAWEKRDLSLLEVNYFIIEPAQ